MLRCYSPCKDEFLANVCHESRSPFAAILGMTELVLDTPLNKEQWEDLKIVRSETERLLGLVNDLLGFSKIESRKELADFRVHEVISEIVRCTATSAVEGTRCNQ
jgi:signal transduction histidine kinase